MAKYGKAGCENPAKSSTSEVISNRQSMPGVQMPGEHTRKVPGPKKAGQDVAGEANQVKITTGNSNPGRQTWKGAREGYTSRSTPDFKGAEVGLNVSSSGGSAKQSVKGKNPPRTDGEAKSVAGKVSISSRA